MPAPELPTHIAAAPLNEGRVHLFPEDLWGRVRSKRLFYPANQGGSLSSDTCPKITGEQLRKQGLEELTFHVIGGGNPRYTTREIAALVEEETGQIGVILKSDSSSGKWESPRFSRGINNGEVAEAEWTKRQG
jgi:hypothetical protein